MVDATERDIRCAKHPDKSLGIVFTDNASAWCPICKRWVGTTGDRKSATRKPTQPKENHVPKTIGEMNPAERRTAGQKAAAALKAEIEQPATNAALAAVIEDGHPVAPSNDPIEGQEGTTAMPTKSTAPKKAAPRKAAPNKKATAAKRAPVRYVCDGRVMPDNQNRLSSIAYQYTNGIKKGERRIGSAELGALLKKLGVADPKAPGWKVELPNGVKVEARTGGGTIAAPARAAAKATPVKKAAAIKSPASAKMNAAKAAKKATATRPRKAAKA